MHLVRIGCCELVPYIVAAYIVAVTTLTVEYSPLELPALLIARAWMLCRASEVRVLDRQKEMVGVMPLNDALDMADDQGQDLILIAGDAQPPLVRICAASTFKYEFEKSKKVANKKQRESKQELKELKMTPRTEIHDLEVRIPWSAACMSCRARYNWCRCAHALHLSAHKLRSTLSHTRTRQDLGWSLVAHTGWMRAFIHGFMSNFLSDGASTVFSMQQWVAYHLLSKTMTINFSIFSLLLPGLRSPPVSQPSQPTHLSMPHHHSNKHRDVVCTTYAS